MNRRQWLFAAGYALSAQRIRGANDRVNVGVIGCGARGRYVAGFMKEAPNTAFPVVADVYLTNANRTKKNAGVRNYIPGFPAPARA